MFNKMFCKIFVGILICGNAIYANVDFESLKGNDFVSNISSENVDRFSASTMNALGIRSEYIAQLAAQDKLIKKDSKKWEYLIKNFEAKHQFVPVLRKMLADANIPQEFLFLAMAESGFNAKAKSSKKAVGIWQLMPLTAKELGLTINEYIDERRDPIKSTKAAIKYLQYLYANTGKWYLAAMAYNCGLGCVQKALQKAQSDDVEVLLDDEQKYVSLETRGYLRKIISMSLLFSNAYNLKIEDKQYLLNRGANDSIVAVNVKAGNTLAKIAHSANMKLSDLKLINEQFKYNFIPPTNNKNTSYQVYIPYDKLSYFRQHFKDTGSDIYKMLVVHKVKKGDTLSSISRKYKVNVAQIKSMNSLKNAHLSINQKLILPVFKNKDLQLAALKTTKNYDKIPHN